MKASNFVAAVAGGLVLGAAVFLPLGASAVTEELKQVAQSQQKVSESASQSQAPDVAVTDQVAQAADLTPIAAPDPTPAPIAVAGPTFSAGDDEDSNDDESGDDSSDDSNEMETDD